MKKLNCLFILLFTLLIPRVYAFTYDMETDLVRSSNTDKSLYDIRVSLKDIKGTDYGIAACNLNIVFNGDVKLNSSVRSLGSWTMTTGNFYLFDTGSGVHSKSDLFIIPVKVETAGTVEIVDIECFDDQTSVKIENKSINLEYVDDSDNNISTGSSNINTGTNNNNNSNNGNNSNNTTNNNLDENEDVKDSNCDLSNIILSEGVIDFDTSVTDYYIEVNNLDDLIVEPILVSDKANYTINKEDETIIINVTAEDGTEKVYTIFVENVLDEEEETDNDKNSFVPIFIGIILVLVVINVFRIVKNMKVKS